MTRNCGKNLKNRFEEAYGDAVNLHKRYPLASLGFFFLLNVEILDNPTDFLIAVAMLRKLQGEDGVYDASALLLADLTGHGRVVSSENTKVPVSLSAAHFFAQIIDTALVRGPMNSHRTAMKKAHATIVNVDDE